MKSAKLAHYERLASKQHGYLLASQVSTWDVPSLINSNFILPDDLEEDSNFDNSIIFLTQECDYSPHGQWYAEWLRLLPQVPPEDRTSPPVFVEESALMFHDLGVIPVYENTLVLPPEFEVDCEVTSPHFRIVDYALDEIEWEWYDGVPVQTPLSSLRWLADTLRGGEFDWVSYAYSDAYQRLGFSFDQLAATLSDSAGFWMPSNPTPDAAATRLLGLHLSEASKSNVESRKALA